MVLHESVLYEAKRGSGFLSTAAKIAGGALLGAAAMYGLQRLHDHHDEHKPPKPPVKQPEEHKPPKPSVKQPEEHKVPKPTTKEEHKPGLFSRFLKAAKQKISSLFHHEDKKTIPAPKVINPARNSKELEMWLKMIKDRPGLATLPPSVQRQLMYQQHAIEMAKKMNEQLLRKYGGGHHW